MNTITVEQRITVDGEITVKGLPIKRGQYVEVIVVPHEEKTQEKEPLTVHRLKQSGLIGLWKDREDITNSASYARLLREQAQLRQHP
ncbi:MAG TPA: hypothetical protein PLL36_05220 [Candidatus Hydrogenedentes bacterium]|jgi:hypothetical protein|nr:hypothetical protein [Candidatus Hydrogenedentota bacterium]HQN00451.1 hypothetical protein [Candidatus Hydrogenedentota bacterium]